MSKYIPSTDGGLRDWSQNFSSLITANPSTYGLMPSDAAAIAAAVGAYLPAYTAAVDPATKTKATVAAKDSAKAAMLITLRRYAQFIKLNVGVTNQEKAALGINIDDTSHTPVPAPTTKPACAVVESDSLQHTLRFTDASTPTKRGKPAGVLGVEVYYVLTPTTPPTAPGSPATAPITPDVNADGMKYVGVATHQPYTVTFNPSAAGQTATYFVRWITRTAMRGPWSDGASKTVAA